MRAALEVPIFSVLVHRPEPCSAVITATNLLSEPSFTMRLCFSINGAGGSHRP